MKRLVLSTAVAAAVAVLSSAGGLAVAAAPPPQGTPAAPAAAQASASPAAPQGDAERGKKVFAKVGCYQCHGWEGQGSTITGPRIAPNPLPFAALSKYVRSPKGDMPPFKPQILPDSDLADIYAFLRTRARGVSIDSYFEP